VTTVDQIRAAWLRSLIPMVREESIPIAVLFESAWPVELIDDWLLLVEFPREHNLWASTANHHRELVQRKLCELTGEDLALGVRL
jgi:hypothetical protein